MSTLFTCALVVLETQRCFDIISIRSSLVIAKYVIKDAENTLRWAGIRCMCQHSAQHNKQMRQSVFHIDPPNRPIECVNHFTFSVSFRPLVFGFDIFNQCIVFNDLSFYLCVVRKPTDMLSTLTPYWLRISSQGIRSCDFQPQEFIQSTQTHRYAEYINAILTQDILLRRSSSERDAGWP